MIYLSQLILNPASRMVQSERQNPYEMHRTLLRGFVGRREEANVLHRLEINRYSGVMALLVQSTVPPDWHPLTEVGQGQYLLASPVWKSVDLELPEGRILRFRLVANPTRRRSSGKGHKPGPRYALYKEDAQSAWLHEKAQKRGFRLIDLQISRPYKYDDVKRALTLHTVQFDGHLQITDAALFIAALQTGIGPAKAFGCGLLSLAP